VGDEEWKEGVVDKVQKNPIELIQTGDLVEVDADQATVTLLKKGVE
jgi:hypothetical protein